MIGKLLPVILLIVVILGGLFGGEYLSPKPEEPAIEGEGGMVPKERAARLRLAAMARRLARMTARCHITAFPRSSSSRSCAVTGSMG